MQSNQVQKEIENNSAEIEVLENFSKFVDNKKDYYNAKKGTDLLFFAGEVQNQVIKREKDLQILKIENEGKIEIKDKLKIKLEEINYKLDEIKEESKVIKNKLLLHYHKILNKGIDTRQEGLIWVIKAIWNLGHNVIMYYFPSFLDEKSIDFLFSIAHKEFSLQKINNEIEEIKNQLKNRLFVIKNNKDKKNFMNRTFKTETKVSKVKL
jgi:hypothetical protein